LKPVIMPFLADRHFLRVGWGSEANHPETSVAGETSIPPAAICEQREPGCESNRRPDEECPEARFPAAIKTEADDIHQVPAHSAVQQDQTRTAASQSQNHIPSERTRLNE
jgi:hypothetical protein